MTLYSTSRTIRTRFCGDDCFYIDHNGMRVVADVEGAGRFDVKGDVAVFVDGLPLEDSAEFSEHLLVLARAGVVCEISALLGSDPGSGRSVKALTRAEGCGWVVSSAAPVVVDGCHESSSPPVKGYPVPFFESVASVSEMKICHVKGLRAEIVDSFDLVDQDALSQRDWKVQNGSDLFDLDSQFTDGTKCNLKHMSHLNTASWSVNIPVENEGLILRKLYDRFHGKQRARVMVDGQHAGWWYVPEQDRNARWAWSSFGIPKELCHGKSEIRISVDPPAGVPLWDIARLELLAILPL